jgi:hypothetical protein
MVHLLAAWMVTIDPRKMPLAVGIYAARKRPDTADWGKVTFCLGISKPRLRNKAHREAMGAHRETNIRTHLKPLIHLSDGHIPEYQESQDLYSLLEGLTASSDSHMSCLAKQLFLYLKTPKELATDTLPLASILQENYLTPELRQHIIPRNSSMQRLGDCCEGAPTVWMSRNAWTDVMSMAASTGLIASNPNSGLKPACPVCVAARNKLCANDRETHNCMGRGIESTDRLAPFSISAALIGLGLSVLASGIGARGSFLVNGLMSTVLVNGWMPTVIEERFELYAGFSGFRDIPGGGIDFMTSLGFWEMDIILDRVCFLSSCLQQLLRVLMGLTAPEDDWDDMLSDNEDDDNQSVGLLP